MNKKGKIIIGATLAVGLFAIVSYMGVQIVKLKDSCIRLMKVKNLRTGRGLHLTLILGFKNKSDLSLELKSQQYKVYVNDYHVADIKTPLGIQVVSNKETQIPVDINIDADTLLRAGLKNVTALLFDKDKLVVRLQGSVTAKAGIVTVSQIPVDLAWTLKELLEPIPEDSKC